MNNLNRSTDSDTRDVLGYRFKWTKDHLTSEQLRPLQFSYDKLADDVLDCLAESSASSPGRKSAPEQDLILLIQANLDKPVVRELWDQVNTVPDWVDWDQIGRGQEVLYRYALPLLTGFAFHAFFGINGTSRRAGETLARTGGHSPKVLRLRFFETFQMMMQVTQSVDTIKPGTTGHIAALRIRLLHSSVRRRILALAAQRPSYYDVQENGMPINDLDSMQSIFEFSLNHARINMPKQGCYMRKQEELDYLALWRWISYIMGVPHDMLETPERAFATMESVFLDRTDPTDTGRALVESGIKAMEDAPPTYATRQFFEVGTRWFMGNELADALGLGRPGLYHWAGMLGLFWIYILEVYITRSIPYLDKRKIALYRKVFWDYMVESKEGMGKKTTFAFKYIPEHGKRTTKDDTAPDPSIFGPKRISIETVGFYGFIFACICFLAMGISGYFVLSAALQFAKTSPFVGKILL